MGESRDDDVVSEAPTVVGSGGPTAVGSDGPTAVESPGARPSRVTIRPPVRASSADLRYELGAEIARGGMGRVVEATDTRLGRTVALKEALTTDEDIRRRFARETRITARLEHPSIVPVHDAGTMPDGSPFYVMRKVSGQPLEELIRDANTLNKRLGLLPNLLAAANAVAHAHSRGVLHRDLKPSNILVGALGETVVIDWGLAKIIDEPEDSRDRVERAGEDTLQTRIGSVVGTPGFMPPEQLRGEPVDARSDVYALGATLYFLLSRRPPHAAQTGDDMMKHALAGPPTPVGELVDGVPPELATIVEKALAYDRDQRYHDAGGLAADLDRFLKGQLVAAHRYSTWERVARFYRRHRISVTVTSAAVIALLVGGTIAVRRIIKERNRADAALHDALDRNEALEVAHARSLLATNPTAAVAQVKPLAAKRWREVSMIALAARAAGVARGLPASKSTLSLQLSRDGNRLLAAGDDGVIRVHDLAAGTARMVARLPEPMRATFFDEERQILAWNASRVLEIDASRGTQRDAAIRVSEPIELVEAHGNRVAIAGDKHLWLWRDGALTAIADGAATALAWSPDGKLAAIVDGRVIELDGTGKLLAQVGHEGARSIAWQSGALYIGGRGTVTKRGEPPIQVGDGTVERLLAGPGESLVARTNMNVLTVIDREVVVDLPPTSAIGVVAASPTSHFVVAGSDEVVLAWDLDHVLPQRIALPARAVGVARSRDQLVASHEGGTASWIDVRSGARTQLALAGAFEAAAFSRDGSRVLLLGQDQRATVYGRDGRAAPVPGAYERAEFIGDEQLALVTPNREVVIHELGGASKTVFTGAAPPRHLEARGDWIAVLFEDGSLWRYNATTRDAAQLPAQPDRWILLLDDGDVAMTDRTRLRIWKRDGTYVDFAPLPPPVNWLFRAGPNHLVVYSGGDSGHIVELGGAHRISLAYQPGSRMFDLNFGRDLGVYHDSGGRLFVTQPVVGDHWRIAKPWRGGLYHPGITPDETRIFAVAGDSVLVWSQTVPQSAAETIALVEQLTNARATGSGHDVRLIWH